MTGELQQLLRLAGMARMRAERLRQVAETMTGEVMWSLCAAADHEDRLAEVLSECARARQSRLVADRERRDQAKEAAAAANRRAAEAIARHRCVRPGAVDYPAWLGGSARP